LAATILVAPAAGGKTQRCIERILELSHGHPLTCVWVVVPDRLQAHAFRRRLALAGGVLGVNVGTFGNLYQEILRRAGVTIPLASELLAHRVLHTAIEKVREEGRLSYYAPISEMPGFLQRAGEAVAELRLARVQPSAFFEWSSKNEAMLIDLAEIYNQYIADLAGAGWVDRQGVNELAIQAMERDPTLISDWRMLTVDGFDSFNNAQLAMMRLLSEQLPEVLITLPGTTHMNRSAHRRFARSLQRIMEVIPARPEALSCASRLPSALAYLEDHVFEAGAEPQLPNGIVHLIEARSQQEEAREALRWLKMRIVRDGLKPRQCALVTPQPESYRPYLREAGLEFGIPLYFTHAESSVSTPAIAALLDLMDLPLRGFPRRLTLETIRAPYFDLSAFGLNHGDVGILDLVSRLGQVVEGMDQWKQAFARLSGADRLPLEAEKEDANLVLPPDEEVARIWNGLRALNQRLQLPQTQTMQEWVRWLEDLLEDIRFLQGECSPEEEAAFLGLREVLRALLLAETIVSSSNDALGFVSSLRSALEGIDNPQAGRLSNEVVVVLRVLEARGLRFQAVVVLGMAEGVFPEIEREDPFLPQAFRQAFGLEPKVGREQPGLFYQAATRADRYLLLTRPYLAEDGEYWEASPFWHAVSRLFKDKAERIHSETPRPLSDAASSEELLFWAVRRGGLPHSFAEHFLPRWQHARHGRDVLLARQKREPDGPYEGNLMRLAGDLQARFGRGHVWSPTRLEVYGICPYRFFVEVSLELEAKEPPQAGFDASQLGSILHAILEEGYRQADDPTDVSSLLDILQQVSKQIFSEAPARYGFRPSPLWEVEQEQLLMALEASIRGLAEVSEGWRPIALEQPFGAGDVRPLELDSGHGPIRIRGWIDRLDQDDDGRLRVIDYKTGSSHLRPRDLVEGTRLQLPLYALAACQALGMDEPVDGIYWMILRGEAGSLRLGNFLHKGEECVYQGPQGAIQLAKEHLERIVSGVHQGSFPPIPPNGGCPTYCAASEWCWRYQPARW
jgi:ATP-dependent helicase/DNAse subunit B